MESIRLEDFVGITELGHFICLQCGSLIGSKDKNVRRHYTKVHQWNFAPIPNLPPKTKKKSGASRRKKQKRPIAVPAPQAVPPRNADSVSSQCGWKSVDFSKWPAREVVVSPEGYQQKCYREFWQDVTVPNPDSGPEPKKMRLDEEVIEPAAPVSVSVPEKEAESGPAESAVVHPRPVGEMFHALQSTFELLRPETQQEVMKQLTTTFIDAFYRDQENNSDNTLA